MSIFDYLKTNRDLTYQVGGVSIFHRKVVSQALRHTTRSNMEELQSVARPSEEAIYKKWREDNKRNVTPDFIFQFVRMMQRVLSQTITTELSRELNKFVFEKVIPLSIIDPNAVVITWPYIKANKLMPPSSEVFSQNMKIDKERIAIGSHHIFHRSDTLHIYFRDRIEVGNTKEKRYIAIDEMGYYILEPKRDNNNKLYYDPQLWYAHGLGRIPFIAEMPGNNVIGILPNTYDVQDVKGILPNTYDNRIEYKESVCWPAFEWFDEGMIRLSSEQVASVKHANPKLVVTKEIQCPSCAGAGFSDRETMTPCATCNGKRAVFQLGDFSTINIKDNKQPGDTTNGNPIYYLEPPAGIKELRDAFQLFFDMGQKSLCNDILEKTGIESGVAKEMRLEPKQDIMQSYGQMICYLIEDLINAERLLDNNNILITITPPVYYQTKSPDVLKLQITESLQGERYMKYIEYINTAYRGNEEAIKLHKYAALYAPLLLYKSDEFDGAYNAGVYDERDAIRRDYAFFAVGSVLEKEPKLDRLKEIKEKSDAFLIEQGVLSEEVKENNLDEVKPEKKGRF